MLTLSKNLTFSLAIVTMLAFGFAFAPAVMATSPQPVLSSIDVSTASGLQVEAFPAITPIPISADATAIDTQAEIDTLITEAQGEDDDVIFYINLTAGVASIDTQGADITTGIAATALHINDFAVVYYDKFGVEITQTPDLSSSASVISHRNTAFPDGRNFAVTIDAADIPDTTKFMTISLPAGAFQHADPADALAGNTLGQSLASKYINIKDDRGTEVKDGALRLILVNAEPEPAASPGGNDPKVVSIVRTVSTASPTDQGSALIGAQSVSAKEDFYAAVTFTEEPRDVNAIFQIIGGDGVAKITNIAKGTPFYLEPPFSLGNYADQDAVPHPSGRDARYHPYVLTIEPNKTNTADIVLQVKRFEDMVVPPNWYEPPNNLALIANRSVLRVQVRGGTAAKSVATVTNEATKANRDNKRTNEVFIPGGLVVPSGGYLVLARGADQAASSVRSVGNKKYKNEDGRKRADNQTDIDFKYNVQYGVDFPYPGDNLELFFRNGGTITLRYKDAPDSTTAVNKETGYHGARKAADEGIVENSLVISEIMWGTDDSGTNVDSQWIELHNPGTADISIDQEEWVLRFDGPTPIRGSHFGLAVDTVSNVPTDTAGVMQYWQVPGSNGRTASQVAEASTLTSMFLKIDTAVPDGTAAASWMGSPTRPVINLLGNRVGTPGAATPYTMPTVPETTTPITPPAPPVPGATAADIAISEIMYSVGRGNLPQWIELHNMSAGEVSLDGWNVEIENEGGSDLTITLGATTAKAGQAVLLVSKNGRNSGIGDEEGDLRRVVDLKGLGVTGTLLSATGFTITLSPPPAIGSSVRTDGDVAGGADWDLPMMDGDRSSLIREKNADGTYKDGTMRMSWHPTSSTGRYGTYYGHPSDMGTPGYVKGGALPVELSMFYPARDKVTGQVVIKWETQSELNNAGFFVKRSTARKGPFTVINPQMIAGAGTTSEKQSYTYTDASAQPNVIYFYQIEDVSLDGKRATLTNAHRLRGHIGAAGKATTTWGELKSQE